MGLERQYKFKNKKSIGQRLSSIKNGDSDIYSQNIYPV